MNMPVGSMGPKLKAACDVFGTGGSAGIGQVMDTLRILDGTAGTRVVQSDGGHR